jgi:hypothetical protein
MGFADKLSAHQCSCKSKKKEAPARTKRQALQWDDGSPRSALMPMNQEFAGTDDSYLNS